VGVADLPPRELIPNPRNWRTHPREQREALERVLDRVGWVADVILNRTTGHLVDGHLRVELAIDRGEPTVPVQLVELEPDEEAEVLLSLDPLAGMAGMDEAKLAALLGSVSLDNAELQAHLVQFVAKGSAKPGRTDPDDVPTPKARPYVKPGDLWAMGPHRILCGDSTDPATVARLFGAELATLVHADPPYGLGKEAEGIANDNLYRERLVAFQSAWWAAWAPLASPVASVYVWGTAVELWRWWYAGGLADGGDLTYRNEIVWDKGTGHAMGSDVIHSYPQGSERCLFLMRGQQFLGSQNLADYWDGYEPLRVWMLAERNRAGWTNGDVNRLTGSHMAGHWFGKSQFQTITAGQYQRLQEAAEGRAFTEDYDHLFRRLFPDLKDHRLELGEALRQARTYFDNAHEPMTDVWQFPRVYGAERFEHATPKPVALVARILKSSSRPDDVIGVPFAGTGPEVIAAEQLGRRAFLAELEPAYVQVVLERWQAFTGGKPERIGNG
jgi:DNA modification methylase